MEFFDYMFSVPPKTLTLVAAILGFLMIDDLESAEQTSLGNFLLLVGQVLVTNGAQTGVKEKRDKANVSNFNHYFDLKREINKLKKDIDELKKS